MREIYVECTWRTVQLVEVPDEIENPVIGSTPEAWWADQVDSSTAALVDWSEA